MEEYSLPKLEEAFERIRDEIFPKWDLKNEWPINGEHPDCVGDGLCDREGKQIVVNLNSYNVGQPNYIDEVLIHEISHAIASTGHGKKWQARMERAALKSESLGKKKLAKEIREDYTAYSDPYRCMNITASLVYRGVEDAVLDTRGMKSFEDVINFVAYDCGMTSKQLLARYKRLPNVYEKAVRMWSLKKA